MKNRKYSCGIRLALVLCLSLGGVRAHGQERGSISGVVTDAGGAGVAHVAVKAWTGDAGRRIEGATDSSGFYRLALPPGTYSLSFSASGWKTTVVRSVILGGAEDVNVGVALIAGSAADTVDLQWLPAAETRAGTPADGTQVKDIPLSSRNYTQAAGLASGVSSQVSNATALGMNSQGVQVGGGSTNNYLIDGAPIAASVGGPDSPAAPNPDAIETSETQSWSYSAGPERYAGANISLTTKSGGDAWHGSAFESVRNDIFNANDFFVKQQGLPEPVLKQNQFGFTIGGSLRAHRLFTFLAYQGTRQSNGFSGAGFAPAVVLPPVPATRTAANLGAAFCPANHLGDSHYTTLFGGVQVACDGSNISPVAVNLLNLKLGNGAYAIPGSGTGAFQTVSYSIPAVFREDQVLFNNDLVLSKSEKIAERFFYAYDPQTQNFTGGPDTLPGFSYSVPTTNIYGVIRLSSTLRANLQNELRISGQHDLIKHTPQTPFTDSQVGIGPVVPAINALDVINISGLFNLGGADQWDYTSVNQYQLGDQVSLTTGRHTLRMGMEVDRRQWNVVFLSYARGTLNVNTFADFLLGLPGCPPGDSSCGVANPVVNGVTTNGSPFSNIWASLGPFSAAYVTTASGIQHAYRFSDASAYFHDDIRLKSWLTLSADLRWDDFGQLADSTGNNTNFWPSLAEAWTVPSAQGTYAGFVVPANFKGSLPAGVLRTAGNIPLVVGPALLNYAPRIGYSLQPLRRSRLMVHGGYGFFYYRPDAANMTLQTVAAVPYAVPVGGAAAANYQASFAQPFPQAALGWGAARTVDFTTGESSNLSLNPLDPNFSVPLTQKWSLELQSQVRPGITALVGYAGAHSVRLQVGTRQINFPALADATHPVNGLTASTVANAALRVPYLGVAANGLSDEQTQGDAKYNALEAAVRVQAGNGLHLQGTYMFSKTLTDLGAAPPVGGAVGQAMSGMNSNDSLDARQQYGPSRQNAPRRLAVNYGWDLPWKSSRALMGSLLNGWGVSGMTIIQSGTPITLNDNSGGTIYGNATVSRAQLCTGMSARNIATPGTVKQRLNAYFNPKAFCAPPAIGDGTGFGNSGVGIILGPGQDNTDMAVSKTVPMGESKLELRAEFFNAFNHPQFMGPDTTVTDPTFGQINSSSVNPRLIQLGVRYSF